MAIGVIFNFPGGTTHGQGRGRSQAAFRRTWAFIFWRLDSGNQAFALSRGSPKHRPQHLDPASG